MDPDEEDQLGGYRHPDRDHIHWHGIATAVARVSEKLGAQAWSLDEEEDSATSHLPFGYIRIRAGDLGLGRAERNILFKWFGMGTPVNGDPWARVGGGRHRLWLTRLWLGDTPVPVLSTCLWGVDPEAVTDELVKDIQGGLQVLESTAWFDVTDPVNMRYIGVLSDAVEGRSIKVF